MPLWYNFDEKGKKVMLSSAGKVAHQKSGWDRECLVCVLPHSCLVFSSTIIKWMNNNKSVPMHIYSLNPVLILAVQSFVPERKEGKKTPTLALS